MNRPDTQQAPPIGDYALIGDCHCSALVSRLGSIDWRCMPRFDSQPCFGRLLDWKPAGYCSIAPTAYHFETGRRYLEDSMVLRTRFETETGTADQFDRAAGTANDLDLFSEEYDPDGRRLWANSPQGLTHLSYISAALALARAGIQAGESGVNP